MTSYTVWHDKQIKIIAWDFLIRIWNLKIQRMSGKGRIGAMLDHGKLKQKL